MWRHELKNVMIHDVNNHVIIGYILVAIILGNSSFGHSVMMIILWEDDSKIWKAYITLILNNTGQLTLSSNSSFLFKISQFQSPIFQIDFPKTISS